MKIDKNGSPGQDEKTERNQQKAKLRKEKRQQLLEQNKSNKWKSYLLGTVFFIVDLFD